MKMNKAEYISLVEREETPLWVSLVMDGCTNSDRFEKSSGVKFELENYRFLGRLHQIGKDDWLRLTSLIEEKFNSEGIEFFDWYKKSCYQYCDRLISVADEIASQKVEYSNEFLLNNFMKYFDASYDCISYILSIFPIQNIISRELSRIIESYIDDTTLSLDSALALLTKPEIPTAIEMDIAGITSLIKEVISNTRISDILSKSDAEKILKKDFDSFYRKLKKHQDQYGWLQTFTYRNKPYTVSDLIQRINNRIQRINMGKMNPENQMSFLDDSFQPELNYITGKLNHDERRMLSLAKDFATLRFYRVDTHFKSAAKITNVFDGISKLLNIPYSNIAYLSYNEIIKALTENKKNTSEITKARIKEGFDIFFKNNEIKITSPSTFSQDFSTNNYKITGNRILKGTSACLGTATGKVKIVHNIDDCINFNQGDILVTPMTTPEFMSAIEKAGGIITDEGGLLCHAAIISRELKIPCVISTNISSHILRDGESVKLIAKKEIGEIIRNEI